ncbi:MAG: osmotically inducible protein C [Gammaproteobacteria bacterium]|nr:MAG: osmotically inducible protein C [Gammaproteobacteria bacterium]
MKATIKWAGEVKFEAETGSGHTIMMDGPADHGGTNQGARPMELMLLGVGGCASFDVVHILKKSRQDVTDCVAKVEAERVDDVPAVFKNIHLHFVVKGNNLKDAHVKRAVELSAEKYCSASIMLSKGGVAISHSYEIQE